MWETSVLCPWYKDEYYFWCQKESSYKAISTIALSRLMGCLHDPTNVQLHYNIWQQTSSKLLLDSVNTLGIRQEVEQWTHYGQRFLFNVLNVILYSCHFLTFFNQTCNKSSNSQVQVQVQVPYPQVQVQVQVHLKRASPSPSPSSLQKRQVQVQVQVQ